MDRRRAAVGSRRTLAALAAILAAAALAAAAPGRAEAGEFTVTACQADGDYASGAFQNFATRGMRWRRACNPLGPGLRGLLTANVARHKHVAVGAQSGFVLEAPPQTAISTLRWSGYAHRRDCRYALQLYAVRPDGSPVGIKNVRADRHCPRPKEAQASSWPRPRTYQLGGATRIVQRVVCVGTRKHRFCSGRGRNFLQTFAAEATVVDDVPPGISIAGDGPLTRGEWVGGAQTVDYEAADNTGIKETSLWVGTQAMGEDPRTCDYSQQIPCPSGPGRIEIQTPRLTEGTQVMHLSAVDAAGNGADSPPATVRIDNSAPGTAVVGVEGGEAWRSRDGFNLAWANPPEGDRAPIVAAHWLLCRSRTRECRTGAVPGAGVARIDGLAVPGPGEWEARVWRTDAAGNEDAANASAPVHLRYDPVPPTLGFEAQDPADPTRIEVQVADPLSGVAGGGVQISRVGSGTWQVLPSAIEGGHIVTRIDDAAMPAGEYQLRAAAHDEAGNLGASESRLDGTPMRLTLPLRTVTALGAAIVSEHKVAKKVRRHGKTHKVKHTVTTLVPQETVRFGRQVAFTGKLLDQAGNPEAGATVEVYSHPPEEAEAHIATLTTGADGGFSWEEKATSSAELRFSYAGSATTLPAEGTVSLLVHGRSTLKVSRRHILNGQSVTFSGRVSGRPLPPLGKLVELQVRLSEEWSTFRTVRSDPEGKWSIRYPFKRTCGVEWFKLRLRLPGEAGYPLQPGSSRKVWVRVKGRPCAAG